MRRLAWPAFVIALVLGPVAADWAAAATPPRSGGETGGMIRGRIIDRTAPVRPVARQPVRLQIVERGTTSERQTRTDKTGAFVFSKLPVGGLRIFLVSTQFQGASYGTARIVLTAAAPVRDASLAVYDAGANRRVLRGPLVFAVVDVVPGALRVTTVEWVRNATDRTVVMTPADPLTFPLPREAVAVTPLDGWRDPHIEAGRITDARAIPPGTARLSYAYQERPRGRRATLVWAPPFGAARIEVLVSDAHLHIAGGGLHAGQPVTASGRRYARWSGGPIAAGDMVAVRLDALPAGGDRWPGGLAAALAAALGLGLAAALRRPSPDGRAETEPRRAYGVSQDVPAESGAGEPRDGVEEKFPAHNSLRAAVLEESESACPPGPGDGVSPRRSPS